MRGGIPKANSAVVPFFFFLVGCAIAGYFGNLNRGMGETGQTAATLVNSGFIGNPYSVATGPTAHVSPVVSVLIAGIYSVFGVNSYASRVALGVIAALLYALTLGAGLRVCKLAGSSPITPRLYVALCAALPIFMFSSIVYSRQWDQPFTSFLLMCGWLFHEQSRIAPAPYKYQIVLAGIAGFGALVSPSSLLCVSISLFFVTWERRKKDKIFVVIPICLFIILIFILPWGFRNQNKLGEFIPTRSNFGLELATGNYSISPHYSQGTRFPHPYGDVSSAREVARLGEVEYMRRARQEAISWVRADPNAFIGLTIRRTVEIFFPSSATVGWFPVVGSTVLWGMFLVFGILRLLSVSLSLVFCVRPLFALIYCLLPVSPYVVTHVNVRYLEIVYVPSIVLCAIVGGHIVDRMAMQRASWPKKEATSVLQ